MNRWKIVLAVFVVILVVAFAYLAFLYTPYTSLSFEENNKAMNNPSRGFYVQFNTGQMENAPKIMENNIRLMLLAFDIRDYVSAPIGEEKLLELEMALSVARGLDQKVIFRAAYGFDSEFKKKDPFDTKIILEHIGQLAPIFEKNRDVLLTVQAGFIGPWGEWHSTNLAGKDGEIPAKVINDIVEALCEAVPEGISIGLRRPGFIRKLEEERIDLSRIAYHNDALLASETDMGTYNLKEMSRQAELDYISRRKGLFANGGEMTNLSEYTVPKVAIENLSKLGITYLNHEYNKDVLNNWRSTSYKKTTFFEHVKMCLGYRLVLDGVRLPLDFKQGKGIEFDFQISNTGFSAMSLPYLTELVIIDNKREIIYPVGFEIQNCTPGKSEKFSVKINSADMASDKITVGLRVKDANESLWGNVGYNVELASKKVPYKDGINIFAEYRLDKKGKYVLVK